KGPKRSLRLYAAPRSHPTRARPDCSDAGKNLGTCKQSTSDIFILGHSISGEDKLKIVKAFRETCQAPIISLRRGIGDSAVDGADFHIDPDPEPPLNIIADVMRRKNLVPALESSAQTSTRFHQTVNLAD